MKKEIENLQREFEVAGRRKKKPHCPQCKSAEVIPILYGLPTAKAGEAAREGKILLGGCEISENNPDWHCKNCGHEWGEVNNIS